VTFPKAQLVFFFDPIGKDTPYLSRGDVTESKLPDGTLVREVHSKTDGALLYHLEYFLEATPLTPSMWGRFLLRLTQLETLIATMGIKTVVLDSVTFMELTARKFSQYKLNPQSKEPRQWFGFSTDALEEILMIRFGTLPINVVVLAHIDDQKVTSHGTNVFSIAAPGRLSRRGPGAFSEVYRAYVTTDDSGQPIYQWQTRSNGMYTASTQVGAPDPCLPVYAAIWNT
jgi:hypothetical protein